MRFCFQSSQNVHKDADFPGCPKSSLAFKLLPLLSYVFTLVVLHELLKTQQQAPKEEPLVTVTRKPALFAAVTTV